ncbi:MAG: hypothetical protein PHV30_00310 [Candidatus Margulisbacteria bacterium]|nr:hypothetical protein [Candidatus Margulisiibacteriota bacterium]
MTGIKYVIEHYPAVIAILGTLSGLVSVLLGAIISANGNKIKQKELQLTEQQFISDKKHQISKEKYQKLFKERIEVYKQIFIELKKLSKNLRVVGNALYRVDQFGCDRTEVITTEKVNVKTLQTLFKLIEDNSFLISEKTLELVKGLEDFYWKYRAETDSLYDVGAIGPDDIDDAIESDHKKFYEEQVNRIKEFYIQIEQEISSMKKDMGFN